MRVLVTGVTGYIGGRLVPRLLERNHDIRVLVRDPERISGRPWADKVDVWRGDLLAPQTLEGMCEGIDHAYYLVHSIHSGSDYEKHDRLAAEAFCQAASGVRHAIYVGGLLPETTANVSKHLLSRAEIGAILARNLPTTELRAGPIIGSGSASFELLRYLTERFPMMITPSWVRNEIQPIAVREVLGYLLAALDRGPSGVVDIGTDRLTYEQMMKEYAQVRGLRRLMVAVPGILPPRIGARFMGLVTPIPTQMAVSLVEGMLQPLVADQERARSLFPEVEPIPYRQALELALRRIQEDAVETRWSGALAESRGDQEDTYEHRDLRGLIREGRSRHVDATPEAVFRVFSSLGGERGWLSWNWAWKVRGFLDRLVGGPGLRRGRRDPHELLPGEAVDFWRVDAVEPNHLLRLRAEVKLPGRGWLQFEAVPEGSGTRLTQVASFAPHGLAGALYWYLLYPFHRRIFTGMIRAIGDAAVRESAVSE